MEDETSQSEAPAETTQEVNEAPEPSLEDISKEFSVEEQASQFSAKPQPAEQSSYQPQYQQPDYTGGTAQSQQPQEYTPDPVTDPDAYNWYVRQQAQLIQNLQSNYNELSNKVGGYEQQMEQQRIDADISKAVSKINETLNVDPDLAEIALESIYRKDPAFQNIWNNRDRNPQAFEKALGVVANRLKGTFANQADPQLVENQRAAQSSQRTTAATTKQDPNEEWANMSQDEFDRNWGKLRSGA